MRERRARRAAVLAAALVLGTVALPRAEFAAAAGTAPAGTAPPGAAPSEFPRLSGRVVDAAGILSPTTERTLTEMLAAYQRDSGGTQVVVATVPSLGGRAIEEYGYRLGRHWGIGQAGEDTGALLIVAPAERQVRIEVGYGLEGQLTDAVSWDIIQGRVLPAFRQGNYDAGVIAGTRAIIEVLGGSYEMSGAGTGEDERRRLPAIVFWIFVAFIILSSFGGRGRGGLGQALIIGSVLSGGGRGGFGGGGGFSGGGGSFGGGGASGGW